MGRSQETFSKKENEKKRQRRKQEKQEKKEERKANSKKGAGLEDMMAYIDENGNLSDTPPDAKKMRTVRTEDIRFSTQKQEDMEPEAPRTGTVTFFNNDKGYGFIKDRMNGDSIFVHANGLEEEIKEGDHVSFTTINTPKGPNAVEVKKVPKVAKVVAPKVEAPKEEPKSDDTKE